MPLIRKLYQQGNSVVVSIPTYMLEHIEAEIGDNVIIKVTPRPSIEITTFLPEKTNKLVPED